MTDPITRRDALSLGAAVGVVGTTRYGAASVAANCDVPAADVEGPSPTMGESRGGRPAPVDVRGAIYIPARAYTLYQMWRGYVPAVVERDLGYATDVNLNAIRTWLCYEAWREDPDAHEEAIDHFLGAAADRGLSVMLGLFDLIGRDPTEEWLHDTNPRTATATRSPSKFVIRNPERWDGPRRYVEWFMERYGDDDRLLAVEVMNEPGWWDSAAAFARDMFETMVERRGSVPLTVGSTSVTNNTDYADWGSEILQFHYNFAPDRATYWDMLREVGVLADTLADPVWLTEWQRVRPDGRFGSDPPTEGKTPNYSSLAPLIHDAGFGNFFWSLMVKPAWVQPQRRHEVINGLFHEDGAVWSLEDARAIKAMSGDPSYDGVERQEWPEWADEIIE